MQQKNKLLRQKVISAPLQLQDEYEDIAYRLYTTIELQELEIKLLQPHDSDTLEQLEKDRKLAEQKKTISQLENDLLKQNLARRQLRKQLQKYENVVQKLKTELLEKNTRLKLLELEN